MKQARISLLVLLAVSSVACSTPQVTGVWLAEGQPSMPWTVVLEATGSTLSGAVSHVTSGPVDIYDGYVDGGRIEFKSRSVDGFRVITFTGRVDGDSLRLARQVQVEPGGSPGGNGLFGATGATEFTAVRVSDAPVVIPLTDSSVDLERRDRPVTAEDVRILERASDLLASESVWNRSDDRECADDEHSGRRSLFCALQRAAIEVLGSYDHRRVALQEVRFTIEAGDPEADFEHRLMNFNNLTTTAFADVKGVLIATQDRVSTRLPARDH